MTDSLLISSAIFISLLFAFVNGFHDGCNVIATIISSRTMRPRQALFIACLTELIAPLLLGTSVANTIGKNILDISFFNTSNHTDAMIVLFSSLTGSILWNLLTWKIGLPSSSSHALIGGLIGAGALIFGIQAVHWYGFLTKVVLVLFLTPLIGFLAGYLMIHVLNRIAGRCTRNINKFFKFIQLFSMIFLASSHSSNDSQKTMGIMAIILVTAGTYQEFTIPFWVMLSCAVAISAGLSLGGWSIVKTVGTKIYKLKPMLSFNAQMSAALVIMTASSLGSPVSTSQIVSSSIMGTGAGERANAVNWKTVKDIVLSWLITIPSAALIAIMISVLLKALFK